MATYSEIRQQLAESFGGVRPTMLAKVTEVDKDSRTCTVDDDGAVYYGVRLQCIAGGNAGLVLFPPVGACVLAVRVEKSEEWAVIAASEIESWRIDAGKRSVELDGGAVVFNGGSLGLIRIDRVMEWMDKVYNDMQSLITLLSSTAVAGNGAPLGAVFTPTTPKPVRDDFEDTAVKH